MCIWNYFHKLSASLYLAPKSRNQRFLPKPPWDLFQSLSLKNGHFLDFKNYRFSCFELYKNEMMVYVFLYLAFMSNMYLKYIYHDAWSQSMLILLALTTRIPLCKCTPSIHVFLLMNFWEIFHFLLLIFLYFSFGGHIGAFFLSIY